MELNHHDIEWIREGVCEGCRCDMYLWESGCYKTCDYFRKDADEYLEQMIGEARELTEPDNDK